MDNQTENKQQKILSKKKETQPQKQTDSM